MNKCTNCNKIHVGGKDNCNRCGRYNGCGDINCTRWVNKCYNYNRSNEIYYIDREGTHKKVSKKRKRTSNVLPIYYPLKKHSAGQWDEQIRKKVIMLLKRVETLNHKLINLLN